MRKVHLKDPLFGTLRNGDHEVGRMACRWDPMQRLRLQRVTRVKKKITCKRCAKLAEKR